MPGPLPKRPDDRRRSPGRAGSRTLPAHGRKGKAPALGKNPAGSTWTAATRAWWEAVWASPMAVAFLDADVHLLRHLAAVIDKLNRGEGSAAMLKEVRLVASEFGLTPTGRRRLEWHVEQEPETAPAPTGTRRPYLVDVDAA